MAHATGRCPESNAPAPSPTIGSMDTDDSVTVGMAATEELTADQRAEIVAVCNAANHTDEFWKLFEVFVRTGGRHFYATHGRAIVSHAVVNPRGVQPEGMPVLRTAYLDAVATAPIYQGQGYGTAVMQLLAQSIDDFDIACLQTDEPGFYDRLGWELWQGPLAGRSDQGLVPTPDQHGVMVHRLPRTPPLDLGAMLSIEWQPDRFWE